MSKRRAVPPVDDYGIGTLLALSAKRWSSIVDVRLDAFGLSATKYAVLCAIDASKEGTILSQRMIADMTGYDVMLVSSIITKLQQDGLVDRMQHPTDVRAHSIALSQQGASVLKKAHKQVAKVDRDFFADSAAPEKIRKVLSPTLKP